MLQKTKQTPQVRKDIFNVGGSIAFTMSIELGMLLAVGMVSGLIGSTQQAAMSYSLQFIYFESLFLAAFSFSCAQEIARAVGEKQYVDASRVARYGLLTSFFYLQFIPIIVACAPQLLLIANRHADHDILPILAHLVPLMSVGVLFDIVRYNFLQQLRTLGDLTIPNTIAIVSMGIGIVLAAILGLKTSLEIDGVAAGYTIGIGLGAMGLGLRWKNQIGATQIGRIQHDNTINSRNILRSFSMFSPETTPEENGQLLEGNASCNQLLN